jgi:hypothetical protein
MCSAKSDSNMTGVSLRASTRKKRRRGDSRRADAMASAQQTIVVTRVAGKHDEARKFLSHCSRVRIVAGAVLDADASTSGSSSTQPQMTACRIGRCERCGKKVGAGEGNRTLVFSLEGCCSTIELHPRPEGACSAFRSVPVTRRARRLNRSRRQIPCPSLDPACGGEPAARVPKVPPNRPLNEGPAGAYIAYSINNERR